MFTGIITDIGTIRTVEARGDVRAVVGCHYDMGSVDLGASIACDGVCLTVVKTGADHFAVDISQETLNATNLSTWAGGRQVNLERALKVGDELGGHIVSGHVDGVAQIIAMHDEGDSTRVTLRAPEGLARFIAPKGSVALNGTSLTVNDVRGCDFDINFIPHTKQMTTWATAAPHDTVNLEVDTMARYVARLHDWSH